MTRPRRAAVLGAGIMGSCTALRLARRGVDVDLFDEAPAPFSGASRWNEGKIHLGYMYAASRSLETTRALLPGGFAFKPLVEDLLGTSIDPATADADEIYLVHRDSVIDADAAGAYFDRVAALVCDHPEARNYVVDARASRVRRLSSKEVEAMTDSAVVGAGFHVIERSVSTRWIADRIVAALGAEPRIRLHMAERVVDAGTDARDRRWSVKTTASHHHGYDLVVNALWHGRPAIDRQVEGVTDPEPNHRYRTALFVRTRNPLRPQNAVICAGPFGDIKTYGDRDFYLSWYPVGMLVSGNGVDAPPVPDLDAARRGAIADATFAALGGLLPMVHSIRDAAESVRVEGGWVYAQARGTLDDPRSTLHRRDRLGITWREGYVSVDTGKYSVAPYLAREIARRVTGE